MNTYSIIDVMLFFLKSIIAKINLFKLHRQSIRFLSLMACFMTFQLNAIGTESELTILYRRLFDYYLESTSGINAETFLTSQLQDGSWADINYDDRSITNWEPVLHLDRIEAMAKAYNDAASQYFKSQVMLSAIETGLLFYYSRDCRSDNWFFNDIGQQRRIGPILILMKQEVDEGIIHGGANFLVMPAYNHSGTNLVWLSTGLIQRGVVQGDASLVQQGVDQIASTILITHREGIQRDYSFLYHGMQIYNGGYGSWLIGDVSLWMYHLRSLSFGFQTSHLEIMTSLLLDGDRWMGRANLYDFSVTGRNLTRRNEIGRSHLVAPLNRMKELVPARSFEIQGFIDNIISGGKSALIGNKHFWRADYMAHQGEKYFFGIKMCSSRTNGTEHMNGENSKGYWLPFGATTLMKEPSGELTNIFPLWDWTKIPGVTNPEAIPDFGHVHTQSKTFVGGVSAGKYGVAVMDFEKLLTRAKKSWFVFDNRIIALGAGISSLHNNDITTSINQSYLNGVVVSDGQIISSGQNRSLEGKHWVHHNNTGYVMMQPGIWKITSGETYGNWNHINTTQKNVTVTGNIFKLWIEHGIKPVDATYAYAIIPDIRYADMAESASMTGVVVLENNSAVQAVTDIGEGITGAIFYEPGSLVIDQDLSISVDKPCAVIIDQSDSPLTVFISDPAQSQSNIKLKLNYNGYSTETLNFSLPLGDLRGSTISQNALTLRTEKLLGLHILNKYLLPLELNSHHLFQAVVNILGYDDNDLLWESSNEDVVVIDVHGFATAIREGEASIRVKTSDEKYYDDVNVIVRTPVINQEVDLRERTIVLPGGQWNVSSKEINLLSPIGASMPSPANNMVLLDIPVTNDYIFSFHGQVKASTSVWDDFVLVWGHKYPENDYWYAHFCESNDADGSGIFNMYNGIKSVQLADIVTPIAGDQWHRVDLWVRNGLAEVFLDNRFVSSIEYESSVDELVGVGSYNDVCVFKNFKLWSMSVVQNIEQPAKESKIEIWRESGDVTVRLSKEIDDCEVMIFNLFGSLLYQNDSFFSGSLLPLGSQPGCFIVTFRKGNTFLTKKVIIN